MKTNSDMCGRRTPSETSSAYGIVAGNSSGKIDESWISLNNSQSVLGSAYSITADATYEYTGLSITLPSAGNYHIYAEVRGYIEFSAGADENLSSRLYSNDTGSYAPITNSIRLIVQGAAVDTRYKAAATTNIPLTATTACTIRLYASRSAATWTTANINSDTSGYTALGYIRLSKD